MEDKKSESVALTEIIEEGKIHIYGAREHNLKNINLTLPRNKLIVFTGLSGSGKSSLAFDTIYAEGQRRYMETFQAYARQFIGGFSRPDVEKIDGLSPVISIEQKTTNKNPRSTVGTITEIYDFLRLLYARIADAHSYLTGNKMVKMSDEKIIEAIFTKFSHQSILILAPLVKGRKGHYRELFEHSRKSGFTKVRIDGTVTTLKPDLKVSRYKIHDIELVIDTILVSEKNAFRLKNSILTALKNGRDTMMVLDENENPFHFSRNLMDPETGLSYDEPQPNSFSFNSPYGYCPDCRGTGFKYGFDEDSIIPDHKKSISEGAIVPLSKGYGYWFKKVFEALARKYDFKLTTPFENIPKEAVNEILHGSEGNLNIKSDYGDIGTGFQGVINYFEEVLENGGTSALKTDLEQMTFRKDCPSCRGYRLKTISLQFKIDGKHIGHVANMQIDQFYDWISKLEKTISGNQKKIAEEIIKEIKERTQFLLDVGLSYLSLNRPAYSISGGESQRIRLATQIGSQLINVLYILDEPSIGLHQRDNHRLIQALKELRNTGNTVIVVEHDKDMMLEADHLVDLGPGAGINGGHIVAEGTPETILNSNSLTSQYLNGEKEIPIPLERRKGTGKYLILKNASGHNLKKINLKVPLGQLICVTGVSGSGKSSLITQTLYPVLKRNYYRSNAIPLPYEKISGLSHIDKVIEIDQSPIGRTPRSNPATYTGVFTHIRKLFSELPEAKIRGYKPGRFSFNVKGGRCEECQGAGLKTIEMNFLPDVYIECPVCMGRRYNRETLEVRYKGKSISDVLDMTVNEALHFFENIPPIKRKIKTIKEVGLGYIKLGQPSTTVSGGEAQRIKLATELSKISTGKTFYILDEPTTGLHFEDIRILMDVINKLVDRGNTVMIIEHNMDVIKLADHIIDLGPEGGNEGGKIIAEGTPEEVAKSQTSYTAQFLRRELELQLKK